MGFRQRAAGAKIGWHVGEGNRASNDGRREEAIAHYVRAVGLADQHGLLGELLGARMNLATEYLEVEDFVSARPLFEAVIEDSRRLNVISVFGKSTQTWTLRVDAVKGLLAAAVGADDAFDDEIAPLLSRLVDESPGPRARGSALVLSGLAYMEFDRPAEAARSFVDAAEAYADAGAIIEQAHAAWSAAVTRDAADDGSRALRSVGEARRLFDASGDFVSGADCAFFQGDLLCREGDYDAARNAYAHAERVFEHAQNYKQLVNVRMALWRLSSTCGSDSTVVN